MAKSKKHHYLPQFYLRGFATSNESLWLYRKIEDTVQIPTTVHDAGAQNHLHTLDWSAWGSMPDDQTSVEDWFCSMERNQAETLRQVLAPKAVFGDHRPNLEQLVSVMYHRVPSFLDSVEASNRQMLAEVFEHLYRNGHFPPAPEEIRPALEGGDFSGFTTKIARFKILQTMAMHIIDSQIPSILSTMKMGISTPDSADSVFITGDTPVVLYHSTWQDSMPFGVGCGTSGVEVSFPLSERAILIFRHDGELPPEKMPPEQVRHFNQRMVASSRRFIYSSKSCPLLQSDIQRLHQCKTGDTLTTIKSEGGSTLVSRYMPVTPRMLETACRNH